MGRPGKFCSLLWLFDCNLTAIEFFYVKLTFSGFSPRGGRGGGGRGGGGRGL